MRQRVLIREEQPPAKAPKAKAGGLYFGQHASAQHYFESGCTPLNCILGGGWRENRVINVVGDKSTGKTLLAIEAAANYRRKYPKAPIRYCEVEESFDRAYAESVGLPTDHIFFPNEKEIRISTVEDLFRDLERVIAKGQRSLYIVDSLDALSDEAEVARDVDEKSFGAAKAKRLSELFRKLNGKLAKANVTVMVISQVRDAIAVTFGKKHSRSGGRALDFYASQIVWLHHIGRLYATRSKVKRAYGVQIRAHAEKSKVGLPFRTADFPIYFNFGVEDVVACVQFLKSVHRLKAAFNSVKGASRFVARLDRLSPKEYQQEHRALRETVLRINSDIETLFAPKRRKYA